MKYKDQIIIKPFGKKWLVEASTFYKRDAVARTKREAMDFAQKISSGSRPVINVQSRFKYFREKIIISAGSKLRNITSGIYNFSTG